MKRGFAENRHGVPVSRQYHFDPLCSKYVTRFWKISLNVTFNNSNIYDQIEEKGHSNNFAVVTICSSNLELPKLCELF